MLQTIYETESCFSSASTDGSHQPLELLSGNRSSGKAMPTDGESSLDKGEAGRAAGCSALEDFWRAFGLKALTNSFFCFVSFFLINFYLRGRRKSLLLQL